MKIPVENSRRLLMEEVEFWQDYIAYYSDDNQHPVPQRAIDALKLAQYKLALCLPVSEREPKQNTRLH